MASPIRVAASALFGVLALVAASAAPRETRGSALAVPDSSLTTGSSLAAGAGWREDTLVVAGVIRSTLREAIESSAPALPAAARAELAWRLADVFEYRLDMSRELRGGDAFAVVVQRAITEDGAVRLGDVLAARVDHAGASIDAFRFGASSAPREYFDRDGRSLRAEFLRAPLSLRRISSVFGMRQHPILGIWRAHRGTDYAAMAGTTVRSVGDGVVLFAGSRGSYGNLVEVRHRDGIVSRYGHLRGFGESVRPGARVAIGQTIGYVGATGLATGPHLHFEVLVDGVQRDPEDALRSRSGQPIDAARRAAFEANRASLPPLPTP